MVQLEQSQKELLKSLINADLRFVGKEREAFTLDSYLGTWTIVVHHKGLPNGKIEGHHHDIELLKNLGFLTFVNYGGGSGLFYITPKAREYISELRSSVTSSIERSILDAKSYVQSECFQLDHSQSFARWIEAEKLVGLGNDTTQFTSIGHLCREAIQLFISELLSKHPVSEVDNDQTHTIKRLQAIINAHSSKSSSTLKEFVIDYWKSVNQIIQRQEHGSLKEGGSLNVNDSKRVVLHTLIAMQEAKRLLTLT